MSKMALRVIPYGGFDIPGLEGWLARLAGFITDANAGPVTRLMTVQALGDLLRSLMA